MDRESLQIPTWKDRGQKEDGTRASHGGAVLRVVWSALRQPWPKDGPGGLLHWAEMPRLWSPTSLQVWLGAVLEGCHWAGVLQWIPKPASYNYTPTLSDLLLYQIFVRRGLVSSPSLIFPSSLLSAHSASLSLVSLGSCINFCFQMVSLSFL